MEIAAPGTPSEWASYDSTIRYRMTKYFGDHTTVNEGPVAFIAESAPDPSLAGERFEVVPAHFHLVRQFQVFVGGDEPRIGKHDVHPWDLHYVDPSSPYGPFTSGRGGVAFFTLRPPYAAWETYMMPAQRDKLPRRAGRHLLASSSVSKGMARTFDTLIERHTDGLAAFVSSAGPNEPVRAVDPAGSGGYFGLVIEGSLVRDGSDYPVRSLVWVGAEEPAPELLAGPNGVSLLLVQFPVPDLSLEPEPHDPAAVPRALGTVA